MRLVSDYRVATIHGALSELNCRVLDEFILAVE